MKIHPGLRGYLLLIGVLLSCSWAFAAPAAKASGTQAARPAATQPAASEFVGSDTCATCHKEVTRSFANNPRTRMALVHGKQGVTCENCHGAGKAHVDGGGDASKIFNPAKAPAREVDAKCLSCHAGQHADFDRSPHAKAGVSCISCHSVHHGEDKAQLLKASQNTLCFQCHNDAKPQFNMAFHHKVNEGVTNCSDCHDPHGTLNPSNLKTTAAQNAICTRCHSETAGPFVYEHPVVKIEGCVSCHSPHGSQNARLLNVANVNTLCQQCHSVASTPAHAKTAQDTSCIKCHSQIHGSNASNVFLN